MIYHAIYEVRYRLWKRPDEKIIFSFLKEFLDGSEIAESTFWERLRHLKSMGKLLINHRRREVLFVSKRNSYASVNSSDIS